MLSPNDSNVNDMILFSPGKLSKHRVRKVDVNIVTISVGDICSLWVLLSDIHIHPANAGFLRIDYNSSFLFKSIL